MKYIFTNFGSGNGPFVRTIEMGIELKKLFKEKLSEEFSILVPLVYGERQKSIIKEDFGKLLEKNPNLILFDDYLGQQLKRILYDGRNYNATMQELISRYDKIERNIQNYLKQENFLSRNIHGKSVKIKGNDVILEVSRNPSVATDIKHSYYTSIGYFEKLIQKSIENQKLKLNKSLLKKILPIAKRIESYQHLFFQPEPNCFSYDEKNKFFKENEIRCPPLIQPLKENKKDIIEGFYVLISGIPHLKDFYRYANKINYKIYINQILKDFKHAQRELPTIISNKKIKFVFTRAAWNTIWQTNLSKKPLICLNYIQGDSPEIYFNLFSLKKLKLGVIYSEKNIEKLIEEAKLFIPGTINFYEKLRQKFGTLNGIKYSCNKIAKDFLNRYQ